MGKILKEAILPKEYNTYVFDLYGTLVDIHTEEGEPFIWEKLALFYAYYGAHYTWKELKDAYGTLIKGKEANLKSTLEQDPKYTHEASPEIELMEVFQELFAQKGVEADEALSIHTGQFFRVLTTEYVRLYKGTTELLEDLRKRGKKVYLLSNAQRIFTAYEMQVLDIVKYFDGILISSDFQTKKPDKRFFDILMQKYPMNPKTTLFVGNDSKTDIKGAKTVGFSTYYVKSNISPQGDNGENADYIVPDFENWTL